MNRLLACFAIVIFAGCSDAPSSNGTKSGSTTSSSAVGSAGASSGLGGSSNAGGSTGSPDGGSTGGTGGATGSGGVSGSGGTAGDAGALIPLPPGSREVDGIVNLVDPEAAREVEEFLIDAKPEFVTLRHGLSGALNLFLEHYPEEYDFVYFVTDHPVPTATAAGVFTHVNYHAVPGGTHELEIAAPVYRSTGRVMGVVSMIYNAGVFPPIAHETAHYWGAYLDDRFGFDEALPGQTAPSHWGFSSVNGQLGGFDGSTLRCQTPAGALPPSCTALPSGRTRYALGIFAPFTNTFRGLPYAPLELYLMGLIPASEVPSSFQRLTDAEIDPNTFDTVKGTVGVEASGIKALPFSDITARHGFVKPLASEARHFDAAFVVASASPASDAVMNEVAGWAAIFGKRKTVAGLSSFEAHTGGRATMNTALGSRRVAGTMPPPERPAQTCDAVKQDCPRPELGCQIWPPAFCALAGSLTIDQPCDSAFACARGLSCIASTLNPTAYVCRPYCDIKDATSPSACTKMCPGNFAQFNGNDGTVLGGICLPKSASSARGGSYLRPGVHSNLEGARDERLR